MNIFDYMTQQQLMTLLAAWGGGASVWLAYVLFFKSKHYKATSQPLKFTANWRSGHIFLVLAGPALLVIVTLLAFTIDIKPGDWLRALAVGVFLGGMAPLGILHFAHHATLASTPGEQAPHAALEVDPDTSDKALSPVGRQWWLYRIAPYMAAFSAALLLISCFLLSPTSSLVWSLLAGAVWALLAFMSRVLPNCSDRLAGIVAIVGVNAGLVLSDLAYKEHPMVESSTTGTMEFLLFVQQASVALLSFSLLLMGTRRFLRR